MFKSLRHQLSAQARATRAGLTSLYIVIFASLLFTVITVGFVTIIMSETTQTVNDELSQSAYDSALAGIEDAKLAIMKCLSVNAPSTCNTVLNSDVGSENGGGGCKTVATILGRDYNEGIGTLVSDKTASGNNTAASTETLQAYTCVTITSSLPDYRSYLSSTDTDTVRIVPISTVSSASNITGIRISWYSSSNGSYAYRNISGNKVSFAPVGSGVSAPPTIAVQLIQTAEHFTLNSNEVDYTIGSKTDRGTVFLVPTNISMTNSSSNSFIVAAGNHIANYGTSNSQTGATPSTSSSIPSGFLKANDKSQTNLPYVIKCEATPSSEFACSATIELPEPVNGNRNSQTAMLVISMPYDQPSTDFAVELCNDYGGYCNSTVNFEGVQYSVDSTGRANDVYNRVEARVEISDIYFPYPEYAIQLTGIGETFVKNFWVTPSGCKYSNNSTAVSYSSACSGLLAN